MILSRVLSLFVTLSILLTVCFARAQTESIVRLNPQNFIYDIQYLEPVKQGNDFYTPVEFFIQDRVHGWSSKKTHLVLASPEADVSQWEFDSSGLSEKGRFLNKEFLDQGVEIPSKLIANFVKTRSLTDRNALIRYASVSKSPFTIEKILTNFENAELKSKYFLKDVLNRVNQIMNEKAITDVMQDQGGQTPTQDGESTEIRGAIFNSFFLADYFNERHILPPGTKESDFLTYAKPGNVHLRIAEEMRFMSDPGTQALRTLVKATYTEATEKLFKELMENLGVDSRTLNTVDSVSKVSILFSLTFQELFWTTQSRTLLTKEQKSFLNLIYKMKNLQILGTAKMSNFFNSPERLALTKESFLAGLETKYGSFMSSISIENLNENEIKARRQTLRNRISFLRTRLNILRCEKLF